MGVFYFTHGFLFATRTVLVILYSSLQDRFSEKLAITKKGGKMGVLFILRVVSYVLTELSLWYFTVICKTGSQKNWPSKKKVDKMGVLFFHVWFHMCYQNCPCNAITAVCKTGFQLKNWPSQKKMEKYSCSFISSLFSHILPEFLKFEKNNCPSLCAYLISIEGLPIFNAILWLLLWLDLTSTLPSY